MRRQFAATQFDALDVLIADYEIHCPIATERPERAGRRLRRRVFRSARIVAADTTRNVSQRIPESRTIAQRPALCE